MAQARAQHIAALEGLGRGGAGVGSNKQGHFMYREFKPESWMPIGEAHG